MIQPADSRASSAGSSSRRRTLSVGLVAAAWMGSAAWAADGPGNGTADGTPTPLAMESPAAGDLRHVTVTQDPGDGGTLSVRNTAKGRYAWARFPAPKQGWDLGLRDAVEAEVTNRGAADVAVQLWLVPDRGWEAVGGFAMLAAGERRRVSCRLRETFPDGTPKLDPARITAAQVILVNAAAGAHVDVSAVRATGSAPPFVRPAGRIETPPVEDGPPAAGRRVRHRLPIDAGTGIHTLLHLPEDWDAERDQPFPVIVECPGNVFFVPGCHSTGMPEQCLIGYGMARGRGAIWVSVPFVDRAAGRIAEDGWGNPADTADYLRRIVDDVCGRFGGDRRNVVLTGFSRGAIACGFIGLRDDRVAALWKGLHCCQHFDGDGWNGATLDGAIERARRFRGAAVFHTDNAAAAVRPVTEALAVPATFVSSGLGAHATAMFLDDRESTRRLRDWFADLVAE